MKLNYKSFRFQSLGKKAKKTVLALGAMGLMGFSSNSFAQYLSEGFESGIPTTWAQVQESENFDWEVDTENGSGNVTANTGTNMAIFKNDTEGSRTKLVTPQLDLSSAVNPELNFYFTNENWFGDIDELRVYYKAAATDAWSLLETYTEENASWAEVTLSLPNPSADYYIAFEATSNWARGVTIDDVVVQNGPTCPKPTNLNYTYNLGTATTIWTAGGSESLWEISWGTVGFTPGDANEMGSEAVSTNSHEITGLNTGDVIDFYVKADCGGSDESDWAGPYTIDLNYCAVTSTSTAYGISNFSTTGGENNINNATGPGSYNDYTNIYVSSWEGNSINFSIQSANSTAGMAVWVDWNNNFVFEASEKVYASNDYVSSANGTITIPAGTPNGDYRMRVVANYLSSSPTACGNLGSVAYGEAEDYTFRVVTMPTCFAITDVSIDSTATNGLAFSWTGGTGAEWNVSWGPIGYQPGDSHELGTAHVTDAEYFISNLDPNTYYHIYVQSDCGVDDGVSNWSTYTLGKTLCEATTVPYFVDFEDAPTPGMQECFTTETNSGSEWGTFIVDDGDWEGNGIVYSWDDYEDADSWFFTQGVELEAGVTYKLSYKYGTDDLYSENLKVAYGTAPTSSAMDSTVAEYTNLTTGWGIALLGDFEITVSTTGVYYFGFQSTSEADNSVIVIDDISIDYCTLTEGVDGNVNVCRDANTVDLSTVISSQYNHGTWEFDVNPLVLNGSDLDYSSLATGTYTATYTVNSACMTDVTTATVTIVDAANAGEDGTLSACLNEQMNLFAGLGGMVDMGGKWFDNNGNQMTSANIKTTEAGTFNYTYVVDNGVCDPATATVVVTVDGTCDYLTVGNLDMANITVYPNPANSIVNIAGDNLSEQFTSYSIVDLTGRTVQSANINANEVSINVNGLTNGMYFINLMGNENASVKIEVKH